MAFNVRPGGNHISVQVPQTVVSGDLVRRGDLVGIAEIDATLGDDGNYYTTVAVEGVAVVPTEDDFAAGDPVYTADAGPGLVEAIADGDGAKPVGIATHDSADGKVWLKLVPNVTVVIPEP